MKTVSTIAQVLLGIVFLILGLNGFLHFLPGGPPPGAASNFMLAMYARPYYVLPMGVQVIAGVLLLVNRFVPLALVVTAAVLANALTFHLTMMPEGLPIALVVTGLWFAAALRFRAILAPLLAARTTTRGRFS